MQSAAVWDMQTFLELDGATVVSRSARNFMGIKDAVRRNLIRQLEATNHLQYDPTSGSTTASGAFLATLLPYAGDSGWWSAFVMDVGVGGTQPFVSQLTFTLTYFPANLNPTGPLISVNEAVTISVPADGARHRIVFFLLNITAAPTAIWSFGFSLVNGTGGQGITVSNGGWAGPVFNFRCRPLVPTEPEFLEVLSILEGKQAPQIVDDEGNYLPGSY